MAFLDDPTDLHPITVALVNNMPDSAFLDTENQFRAAAMGKHSAGIEFELYTIKEVRARKTSRHGSRSDTTGSTSFGGVRPMP